MNNITEFKEIPKKHRPIPFWSWNEKLEESETAEQVQKMNNAGIGGFFMHARGGLQTEYMGEEWFDNIKVATTQAEKCGMNAWAYDENGWPSGFGNGMVNGLGVEYQQKYLRMEDVCKHTETAICKSGDHYFYYEVNPFYVDVLDKKVIKKFVDVVYEPYYKRFGNRLTGFFTDEPQISREGIPWSFVFEKEYKERFGEDIYVHLEELFLPLNDYKTTRRNFWKMVTDLFSEAFCKQIYDWCDERNLQFTGHLVLEETLESQLVSNGACMPHYEYFHMPGMDWLGRNIYDCLTARQVSSVAEQLGKDLVISESFALCGHNVSLAELKGIYEWQMVRGINMLCPHLEGYSIRGIRKRDYPPAMYKQQPWWSDFDKWVEAMSRVGMILSEGEKRAEVLIIHPQTTAWTLYNDNDNEGLEELNNKFLETVKKLEEKHISFHLGDETIMERHGRVEDGKLVIGKQKYSYVITSCCAEFLPSTDKLLAEYKVQGGQIITADELPDMNVTGDKSLTYTSRKFNDFTVHYFVNTSADEKTANINLTGKQLDIYTGELCEFCGVHRFEPWGSLMIIDDGSELTKTVKEQKVITLDGKFNIVGKVQNAITLDFCDYYFDGELQEENGYVLNICERANKLERPVKIHQDYYVKVNDVPNELYLVCETPEKFEISVNGQTVEGMPVGYYRDKSFKTLDISKHIIRGKNTISFDFTFIQSDEFYKNLRNSYIFEGEKNKLRYDMEIEPIYLLGDFGVRTPGEWTSLERRAVRYSGPFEIDEISKQILLNNIQMQGFPFFCGELTVEGVLETETDNPILQLDMTGVNVLKIEIGDFKKTVLTDDRVELNIGKGKHKVKLTLINNLRNLLGPHHLEEGEITSVTPGSFYKEDCIWSGWGSGEWNGDYCFVEMSVTGNHLV